MKKLNKKVLISILGLYLASTSVTYAALRYVNGTPQTLTSPLPTTMEGNLAIDPSAPRTEACPINGKLFTEVERQAWEQRRPLLVMIENHVESRPQSGLSEADVVYEAVAEGGITRFMGVYYCDAVAEDTSLAPVRSARTYFLDWASEYGKYPLYAHVGGANCSEDASGRCQSDPRAQALEQIQSYGWGGRTGNDINQFSAGYPTFWRDPERLGHTVATEHTMVTTTERLWELAAERGWTNKDLDDNDWTDFFTPWQFQDEAPQSGSTTNISYNFWNNQNFVVDWQYDSQNNHYVRSNGGRPHIDHNTGEPITVKNVVVQFATEIGPVDNLKHILYETIDEGEALVFKNGQVQEATWEKPSRTERTVFYSEDGDEIAFVPGEIWISVIPAGKDVSY